MAEKSFARIGYRAARIQTICFASFMAVVLITSIQARADVYWSTSAGDWSVASNWGVSVPTDTDSAWITNGGTATITTPGEVCMALSLGGSAGSGSVQMTHGSLTVAQFLNSGSLRRQTLTAN
jgi:hypothetical protein